MRLDFDPDTVVHKTFPTPIGVFDVPNFEEINPSLERAILEREGASLGNVQSNRGGWHSSPDMHTWGVDEVRELGDSIRSAAAHMMSRVCGNQVLRMKQQVGMWANVNRAGAYNQFHNHSDCHFSGVYYVRAGDYSDEPVPGAGCIEFFDPRGAVNAMHYGEKSEFGGKIRMTPQDGRLIMFPAWLYHGVNSFQSEQTRISIAFNVKILGFQVAPDDQPLPVGVPADPG